MTLFERMRKNGALEPVLGAVLVARRDFAVFGEGAFRMAERVIAPYAETYGVDAREMLIRADHYLTHGMDPGGGPLSYRAEASFGSSKNSG